MNERLSKFSKWVITSQQFFWLAVILLVGSSIIAITLFMFGIYDVNTYYIDTMPGGWEGARVWLRIILTSLGSLFATLGILMVNRGAKNFYYFSLTGAGLLVINGFVSNLMFDALKWLLVGSILLTQTFYWMKNLHNMKIKRINHFVIAGMVLTIFIVAFTVGYFGVSQIPTESPFYNKMPVLDPIQFAFTVVGNIMIMFLIVESRIVFFIGNFITFVMFSMIVGGGDFISIPQLIQSILYMTITISGYINIKANYHNNEKERWESLGYNYWCNEEICHIVYGDKPSK